MPGYPGTPSVQTVTDVLATIASSVGNVAGYYVWLVNIATGTIYGPSTKTDSGGNWSIASVPAGIYESFYGSESPVGTVPTQWQATGVKGYLVALNPPPQTIALAQHLRELTRQRFPVMPQPEDFILTPSLSPVLVGANTSAEQTLAVSGLAVGDTIVGISKPTAQAGLGIVGWRVPSAGNVAITFSNNTGVGITPTASEIYSITVRRTNPYYPAIKTQGAANGASTIASAKLFNPASGAMRLSGAQTLAFSTPYPDTLMYAPRAPLSLNSTNSTQPWRVEFETDAPALELFYKGQAKRHRVKVDGVWATDPGSELATPAADGSLYLYRFDFGSRATRRVVIDMDNAFGGVNVGPTDSVWAPATVRPYRAVFIGDSQTENPQGLGPLGSYMWTVCELLGWEDPWFSGAGATGYLAVDTIPTPSRPKFRDRIVTDCINLSPDVVVFQGGINDMNVYSAAAIQAEATLLFAQVRAALPNALIFACGPMVYNSNAGANALATGNAIAAALATVSGAYYIDNLGSNPNSGTGWFFGTGKVGATNNSGNSDLFISSDGTHPSQAGSYYFGRRMAAGIASNLVKP